MDEVLSLEDASKYLKLAKVTLYNHVRKGSIPAFKIGRTWRFNKNTLEEWTKERMKKDTLALRKRHENR